MRLLNLYTRRKGRQKEANRHNKSVAVDAVVHHRAAIAAFSQGMDLKDFIEVAVDHEIGRMKQNLARQYPRNVILSGSEGLEEITSGRN